MRQDMPLIGQEAVRKLMEIFKNKTVEPSVMKLPAQLVVRQSTQKGGG
jgi:DNA-binding LacI/PurR family transcriptional regulator